MRNFLLLLFYTLLTTLTFSQTRTLSGEAEISVFTLGPGNYLYDKFGHSAIRVKDENNDLDIVFNYGTYDFNTPGFYTKFVQGKLLYSLSVSDYEPFYQYYKSEDRWIIEQVLNLNVAQKKEVFDLLVENIKPENRKYLYDFIYDNCATKIRDVFSMALGNDLKYNTELEEEKSFRELVQENLHHNTWGSVGIDLALGAPTDRIASKLEQQFLPDYVLDADAEAKVRTSSGEWQPFVKETITIYEQQKEKKETGFFLFSPWVVFSIIGVGLIALSVRDVIRKKRTKSVDVLIFVITGLVGVVIAILWFASDHYATKLNYNILWAFPISLFFIRAIAKNKYHKRLVHYIILLSILIVLLFFHWITGVQKYPHPILPLLIGLLIRYRYLVIFFRNIQRKEALNR